MTETAKAMSMIWLKVEPQTRDVMLIEIVKWTALHQDESTLRRCIVELIDCDRAGRNPFDEFLYLSNYDEVEAVNHGLKRGKVESVETEGGDELVEGGEEEQAKRESVRTGHRSNPQKHFRPKLANNPQQRTDRPERRSILSRLPQRGGDRVQGS